MFRQRFYVPAVYKPLPTLIFYEHHLSSITAETLLRMLDQLRALGYTHVHYEPEFGFHNLRYAMHTNKFSTYSFIQNLLVRARELDMSLVIADAPTHQIKHALIRFLSAYFPHLPLGKIEKFYEHYHALSTSEEFIRSFMLCLEELQLTFQQLEALLDNQNKFLAAFPDCVNYEEAKQLFDERTRCMSDNILREERQQHNNIVIVGYRHNIHHFLSEASLSPLVFHIKGALNTGEEQADNEESVEALYGSHEINFIDGRVTPHLAVFQYLKAALARMPEKYAEEIAALALHLDYQGSRNNCKLM